MKTPAPVLASITPSLSQGKGSPPLAWMKPVGLEVRDVVEDVDSARQKTKGNEAKKRPQEKCGVGKMLRENQRGKDNKVLYPLLWSCFSHNSRKSAIHPVCLL